MTAAALTIRALRATDATLIAAAFAAIGWNKTVEQYQRYLREQESGTRQAFVATLGHDFAGYATLNWQPTYPFFVNQRIPEIQDVNVLPQFRRRGAGAALLEAAERRAAAAAAEVGIRVGVDLSYGAAQRLYVGRGYMPDGLGLAVIDRTAAVGERVLVNADLLLSFTKRL